MDVGLAILWGEMTTDGRPSWQHGNQEVTQETEAARRQGGEMTSTNSKNSGIKTCMTGEGGESWERPTANNGPIKAERKKERKNLLHWRAIVNINVLLYDICATVYFNSVVRCGAEIKDKSDFLTGFLSLIIALNAPVYRVAFRNL